MVKIIMELVTNQSFTLTTGSRICSRLQCHKNGIQQGSVLAPLLYNIFTYNLPTSVSQKYAYEDALAFMYSSGDWQAVEGVLSQDLVTLVTYLQIWQLKLSWSKTMSATFHLNNREAGRKLNITLDGKCMSFTQIQIYLGVIMDGSLPYHRLFESLRGKLSSHIVLMRRFVGLGWNTSAVVF